jgi:hypothetical protein
VLALGVLGCGTSVASPSASSGTPAETASPSLAPTSTIASTPEPTGSPDVSPSGGPDVSPSAEVTASPTPGGPDAAAAACFGKPRTRNFFVAIAEAVDWNVYCAVLPAGWSVEGGLYHLASGGQMVISYKTATGGHLELREGHWCTDSADACAPNDSDIGTQAFGDQTGELMNLNGGLVLYVDPGQNPSWTATATGIDEATFRQLCANVALVKA